MQEDFDHFGWEGLYRLYGVIEESTDELSSQGEMGKGPIPLTLFF